MLCAGPPEETGSLDAWKRAGAFFNHLGTLSRSAGIQFAYHNHNHEFIVYEGVIAYDERREYDETGTFHRGAYEGQS
jgi:hypothetical protein